MPGLREPLIYIIQTLGGLYLLVMLLRFLLQLVRADFYNPISQFVVRATHPLIQPLRRALPSVGRLDLSSLLLAFVIQWLVMAVSVAIAGANPLLFVVQLALWSLLALASLTLKVFFFALIAGVILSWVAPGSYNPAAQLVEQLCEPLLAPVRQVLPNLGSLDFSPIFVFLAINLLDHYVIARLALQTGMPHFLAPLM